MMFKLNKNELPANLGMALRRAGYHYLESQTGQISFGRRLGRQPYPRFHLYVQTKGQAAYFNLHLDQKRPSYPGARAHSAEYDSEVVKQEAKRLQKILALAAS